MNKEQKKKILYISVSTIIIWMITHGYRFMNNLYTCDSLLEVFQDDIAFQRSLGRFMHPLVMVLRGCITSPWLICVISIAFMIASVYFTADILKIENPILILILEGILICNNTMVSSVAGFLPWVDVYVCSLALAVLGVWLFQKEKWVYLILGCVSFICCMGFYQAYIDVAIALFVFISIVELAENKETKKVLINILKRLGGLAVSGVAYFIIHKIVCKVHHINETASYHGLSEVGNYSDTSLLSVVLDTYQKFIKFFWRQETFSSTILMGIKVSTAWEILLKGCLIASVIIIIVGLILLNKKNRIPFVHIILQIIAIAIMPMALNFVCFLSKGVEHELMIYSFFFVYVFAVAIIGKAIGRKAIEGKAPEKNSIAGKNINKYVYLLTLHLIFFIWNGIVYANQVYFRIDMQDQAALSIATRIIDDIEDYEGYEPGVTPVKFVGALDQSDYMLPVIYLRDITVNGNRNTPFTYDISLPYYLQLYMDVKINASYEEIPEDFINGMPNYPNKDSMKYYNGTLVVKVADPVD